MNATACNSFALKTPVLVCPKLDADASFTGVILEVAQKSLIFETWYRIKRDVPTIVNGFVREEYWAHHSELTPRDLLEEHASDGTPDEDFDHADFDARR